MIPRRKIRLFLDSNVLTGGLVSAWGLDKATLSLCAAKICRLVLAEVVRDEAEHNIVRHSLSLRRTAAEQLIEDYSQLLELCDPELVPRPRPADVFQHRTLTRHEADVPVLLSAVYSRPDWLLTHNTKHFNKTVAHKTGLRIATPADFFRELATLLS